MVSYRCGVYLLMISVVVMAIALGWTAIALHVTNAELRTLGSAVRHLEMLEKTRTQCFVCRPDGIVVDGEIVAEYISAQRSVTSPKFVLSKQGLYGDVDADVSSVDGGDMDSLVRIAGRMSVQMGDDGHPEDLMTFKSFVLSNVDYFAAQFNSVFGRLSELEGDVKFQRSELRVAMHNIWNLLKQEERSE